LSSILGKLKRKLADAAKPERKLSRGLFSSGLFKQHGPQGYAYGIEQGWRGYGAAIYGEFLTYGKDAWVFQRTIAENVGCGVRCVQRWLRRFRELGLVLCHRSKKGERPPNSKAKNGFWHGWSHRIFTALNTATTFFKTRCEEIAQRAAENAAKRRAGYRRYTAEELDRELAKRYGPDPPPD
jgi:hypothetical protein